MSENMYMKNIISTNNGNSNAGIIAVPKEDFTGMKFGRLTVQCRADDYIFPNGKGRAARWHCVCECTNEINVRHDRLKNGKTKSCGCLQKEVASTLIKNVIENWKMPLKDNPTLQLNLNEEGYEPFGKFRCYNDDSMEVYFSMRDYDTIKDYCWHIEHVNEHQYDRVRTHYDGKEISMHRLFGMYDADHINRNALDNRRENLDPTATRSDQNHNQRLKRNNKTGIRGLGYDDRCSQRPWKAQCVHNGEFVLCENFCNKDEAIIAILQAEIKYYPERSWQKQLMIDYNLI